MDMYNMNNYKHVRRCTLVHISSYVSFIYGNLLSGALVLLRKEPLELEEERPVEVI